MGYQYKKVDRPNYSSGKETSIALEMMIGKVAYQE